MPRALVLALLPCLASPAAFAADGPRVIAQAYVRGDGPIAVPGTALTKLGAPTAAHVEVRRRGKRVHSWVEDDALRFDAVGTAGAHTVHAAYRFWVHPEPVAGQKPDPEPVVGAYRLETDRFYGPLASGRHEVYSASAPVWYLARVPQGKSTSLSLSPGGRSPEVQLELAVHIRTAHKGAVALTARWGETDLGTQRTTGSAARGAILTWKVPANSVTREVAKLVLADASPPIPKPPPRDVSAGRGTVWIDAIAVDGAKDEAAPPSVRTLTPVAYGAVPDPLAAAGAARHVILSVPALMEESERLAKHRIATGTPSAVVPVAAVYERYGFGEHTPLAIRAFVLDLMARPDAPLEYLVLAGDATFDRTDLAPEVTIPTLMTRSIYNGATASDPLYVVAADGEIKGSPPVGRLPFREAGPMRAFVDRLIRYETRPPADASRRMCRFITSEARFSPFIDRVIENKFRGILTEHLAPAFDIEATYASTSSPFLWPPPELNEKVIAGLNEGALFFSYVGHGFAEGFDTLRVKGVRHRILHIDDAEQIDIKGTLPVVFVIACTTAQFDAMQDGVGEALMKRPAGPVAYWGASRICHPAFNGLMGQAIAMRIARPEDASAPPRLGQILTSARDMVLSGNVMSGVEMMVLRGLIGNSKVEHLAVEGAMMYTLLGDPALKIAFPKEDVRVEAAVEGDAIVVRLAAPLPDEALVHVSLELPRNRNSGDSEPVANPGDPASFPAIRKKHAAMNNWAIHRQDVSLKDGRGELRLPLGGRKPKGLVVKAWSTAGNDVHQGAYVLP